MVPLRSQFRNRFYGGHFFPGSFPSYLVGGKAEWKRSYEPNGCGAQEIKRNKENDNPAPVQLRESLQHLLPYNDVSLLTRLALF